MKDFDDRVWFKDKYDYMVFGIIMLGCVLFAVGFVQCQREYEDRVVHAKAQSSNPFKISTDPNRKYVLYVDHLIFRETHYGYSYEHTDNVWILRGVDGETLALFNANDGRRYTITKNSGYEGVE